MPPVTIPFARKEAYRNPEYTRAMADLMLQKSQEDARLRLARGQSVSNAWGQFGNVVMSSLTDIAQKRALDEKVARDLQQQNIENVRANVGQGIQLKALEDAAEERRLAREYQQRQERRQANIDADTRSEKIAEDYVPGQFMDEGYFNANIAGREAEKRFKPVAGYDPALVREGEEGPEQPGQPNRFQRLPNWQENVQAETLQRQREATMATILNQQADNLRADQARADTADYRREMLETRRFLAGAQQDQKAFQNMIALSGQVKSHPAYTKMLDFESGLQAVETGLKQGNGLGDIAAINAFQRLVDPGVSVREGDVHLLESAIALSTKLDPGFWAEKIQKGARLPDDMRIAMQNAARDLYAARTKTYNETVGDTFKQQSAAGGIPFSLIGRDFPVDPWKAGGTGGPATPPPPGSKPTITKDANGNIVVKP
jgi:hypothetical protein